MGSTLWKLRGKKGQLEPAFPSEAVGAKAPSVLPAPRVSSSYHALARDSMRSKLNFKNVLARAVNNDLIELLSWTKLHVL